MPAGKLVKIGVWEDDKFIGVVLFGMGAGQSTSGKKYGLKDKAEVAELVRVALNNHSVYVSKIVALSIKRLKQQSPRLRLLISFADPLQDHYGGIYQAGNWIYTGKTSGDRVFYIKGNYYHPRSVYSHGWVQSESWLIKHVDRNAKSIKTPGKHRYLMPLDKKMRRQIEPLAKMYPRPGSVSGSTSDDQSEGGGSIPTSGLTAM